DKLLARLVAKFPSGRDADIGPRPEIQRLLPFEIAIVHSPDFCAARPDHEVQGVGVSHFIGFFLGLSVRNLDVGKRHDGFTFDRLTETIKNTIKADGTLMVPAGSAWIPLSESHRKSGEKPAAYWTSSDIPRRTDGAQKRTRTS